MTDCLESALGFRITRIANGVFATPFAFIILFILLNSGGEIGAIEYVLGPFLTSVGIVVLYILELIFRKDETMGDVLFTATWGAIVQFPLALYLFEFYTHMAPANPSRDTFLSIIVLACIAGTANVIHMLMRLAKVYRSRNQTT